MSISFMGNVNLGSDVVVYFHFDNSNAAATGLSPTCEVTAPDGAVSSDPTVTEVESTRHPGVYKATVPGASVDVEGDYLVTAKVASGATPLTKTVMFRATDSNTLDDVAADVAAIEASLVTWPRALDHVRHYTPVGAHTQATIGSSVTTLSVPRQANAVLVRATGSYDIRFTIDGTTPTTSLGFVLLNDAPEALFIPVGRNSQLKFIRDEGSDATLEYQFVRVTY